MSIFSTIKSAIFGEKGPLGTGHFGTPKPDVPPQTTAAEPLAPAARAGQAAPTPQSAPAGQSPVQPSAAPMVDVEAVLSGMASRKGMDLNWRTSIVDLMKLLDLDSSLDNRKALATELGYPGAKDGGADMNIWLLKAVMRELESNGGTVPAGLRE